MTTPSGPPLNPSGPVPIADPEATVARIPVPAPPPAHDAPAVDGGPGAVPWVAVPGAPTPATVAREPGMAGALVVFWVGLLVVGILDALPDPMSWNGDTVRTVWYLADGLFVLALGLTGLLARRGALSPGAVLLWLAGGLILAADNAFLDDLARAYAWGADEWNTIASVATAVTVTCFAAAYLAVRRSPGVRFAFVPVVLVVVLLWFLLAPDAFQRGFSVTAFRLENGLIMTGGAALMALVVYLAGKVGNAPRPAAWATVAPPGWPQQGWPVQQQWPAQPPAWGQPAPQPTGWGQAPQGWTAPPQPWGQPQPLPPGWGPAQPQPPQQQGWPPQG